jgi:hypothetical protein
MATPNHDKHKETIIHHTFAFPVVLFERAIITMGNKIIKSIINISVEPIPNI